MQQTVDPGAWGGLVVGAGIVGHVEWALDEDFWVFCLLSHVQCAWVHVLEGWEDGEGE